MTNTMKQAFGKAGVKSSEERLEAVADEVIGSCGNSWENAKTLFRQALREDALLVEVLVGVTFETRLAEYLRQRAGERFKAPAAKKEKAGATPSEAERLAALTVIRALHPSPLSWKTELGAVAKLTKEQLEALAARRGRESKIFAVLAHHLPPGGVAGTHLTDEEAERLARKAGGE